MQELDDLKKQRLEKLEKIKELGVDPFPNFFKRTHSIIEIRDKYNGLENEKITEDSVDIAGRIVSMRKMGKAAFVHIRDWTGKLQIYIKKDEVGGDNFELFKQFDIGDIIGAGGPVFATRTGELSILAKKITLLTKSLKTLPIVKEKESETGETVKFDEVHDVEFRYRQRYVDLNINDTTRETLKARSSIIHFLRTYLMDKKFIEVETPVMQSLVGGAAAKPFVTHHNALDMELFLRIAPELYLKRILVGGVEKVFEIGRNFRNEGISTRHNPEFTMLELYEAYADYNTMMDLCESMLSECVKFIKNGDSNVQFGETKIDFTAPWARVKLEDLFKQHAGIDFTWVNDLEGIKKKADEMRVKYQDNSSACKVYDHIFEEKIQSKLVNPTFVYDYPKAWSPLSKENKKNPEIVERFELFMAGQEIGNAYSELNNPIEQKKRMEAQAKAKASGDEEACLVDEDYIRALEYGLVPCGGLGVGIDRFVMLLTDSHSIRDVILFPQLKKEIK
ncbi:MAG: lysine--tRNA ligase [Elusimicrobiota bacterium]